MRSKTRLTGSARSRSIGSKDRRRAADRRMPAPKRRDSPRAVPARRSVLDHVESLPDSGGALPPGLKALTSSRHFGTAPTAGSEPAPAPASITSSLRYPPLVPDDFRIEDLSI